MVVPRDPGGAVRHPLPQEGGLRAPPCGPAWLLVGPEEDDQITADAGGNITPVGGSIPDDTPPGSAVIALMNKATGVCLPSTDVSVQQKQPCVTDGGLYRQFDMKATAAARKG